MQFVLFCLVGGSGVVVDYGVLVPLTELGGLDPRLAAVGAFAAAVTWNYFLNRKITFHADSNVTVSWSYISFVAVCVLGLGVRVGVMHVMMEMFGMDRGRWYLAASFVGIMAATVTNFAGSKYIAFRSSKHEDEADAEQEDE
jgi:putative flippase GtrA